MGPATLSLILINVAVFGLQLTSGDALLGPFALWPLGHYYVSEFQDTVGFHFWQLLTSGFLHGSPSHLFLNMFALFMFGKDVEWTLGTRRYTLMYFAAVLTAALVQLAVVTMSADSGVYPTVGASGGVFGILLAFGALFPRRTVTLLFPPIPMPAWLFVTMYGLIELFNGVVGTAQGVAHFAHLGGMLGAAVFLFHRPRRTQYFQP